MTVFLGRDSNAEVIQDAWALSAPQVITVNGSAGAATLSAAITNRVIRVTATVDTFLISTVAGTVTSTTGHFIPAAKPTVITLTGSDTKISVLAVSTTAGTMYLSELG